MSQIPIAPDEPIAPTTGDSHGKAPAPDGSVNPVTVGIIVLAIAALVFLKPDLAKTIFVFVFTLSILVFVHEWGHFQFARWSGMKVNRFAIGFPPFIYTKKYKGIDYSIGALPIGGMVDIAGLGSEEEMVHTVKGEGQTPVVNRARPAGQKQFQDGSLFARFMVLFAGPLMNFILAIVVFVSLFSIVGFPDAKQNLVQGTTKGSPASKADIKTGDFVVGVGNVKTDDFAKITKIIQQTPPGKSVDLQIKRADKILTVPITPEQTTITVNGAEQKGARVGIEFVTDPKTLGNYKHLTVGQSIKKSFELSFDMSYSILSLVKRAFTGNLTATDKGSVGGPIAIAKAAKSSSEEGPYSLLGFGASLSINLGLLNLLPLPALDGGRILFLGYELIMRRPLDPRKEGLVHAAGMVLLLAFMLFITLRDVIQL